MGRTCLAVLAAALAIQPVSAAEPVTLEPSSKWQVDFDKDKCRLIRLFGPETARNILILEQYFPAKHFGLVAAGPAFDGIKSSIKGNMVRFLPDRPPNTQEPMIGPLEGYGRALYYRAVALEGFQDKPLSGANESEALKAPMMLDPALGADVRFVDITHADAQVRLMTGSLDRPIAVMNECLLDLIGSWGLDPEQHRTATRLAQPRDWQTTVARLFGRIPWERLQTQSGMNFLRVRLIIGTKGEVESCKLLEITDPKLEAETCKGARRVQIDPALDAAGEPMRSYLPIDFFITTGAPRTIYIPG